MLKLHALATCFVLAASVAAAAPASQVPLKMLLAQPQQFNGRRVSFIAYWDTDDHTTSLRAGPSADAPRIYCDFEKPRIPVKLIERIPHGSWVYVVGIFRYVDMTVPPRSDGARVINMGFGWMNSYDREVTDIIEFTRVATRRI